MMNPMTVKNSCLLFPLIRSYKNFTTNSNSCFQRGWVLEKFDDNPCVMMNCTNEKELSSIQYPQQSRRHSSRRLLFLDLKGFSRLGSCTIRGRCSHQRSIVRHIVVVVINSSNQIRQMRKLADVELERQNLHLQNV